MCLDKKLYPFIFFPEKMTKNVVLFWAPKRQHKLITFILNTLGGDIIPHINNNARAASISLMTSCSFPYFLLLHYI